MTGGGAADAFLLGLIWAAAGYFIGLAMIFVVALIINALAPQFQGQANIVQALKAVVYAMTPVWLASIFKIIPTRGIYSSFVLAAVVEIIILAASIYALALLCLGVSRLMKVPDEKKTAFTVVVIVCLFALAALIYGAIVGVFMFIMSTSPYY
ncbi:MAG: YIP1 family protein [Burkholderiales bacterium]|nr:YIP1 family protein [Burkholderiales bacterium]